MRGEGHVWVYLMICHLREELRFLFSKVLLSRT